jgi:ketosteroid isomerase-like protein
MTERRSNPTGAGADERDAMHLRFQQERAIPETRLEMPAPPQREAEAVAMSQESSMSQDNVEIARQGFETYNRYGVRAVAEQHWHPDVEWHVGPWAVVLGGQTQFRGREAGIAAIHELEAVMGVFTADVLDAVQGPEGVFVAVRLHGKGAGSGAAVDQRFWYAIEVDEGW